MRRKGNRGRTGRTRCATAALTGLVAAVLLALGPAVGDASAQEAAGRPDIRAAGSPAASRAARSPAARQDADYDAVRAWVRDHRAAILRRLVELVSIPDVAADTGGLRRNAEWIRSALEKRGVRVRLIEAGGPPVVVGRLPVPGATRTILFYAHYDGQPVDPARWRFGAPFEPTLRSGPPASDPAVLPLPGAGEAVPEGARLYGRAVADDRGPIVALLAALDALRAQGAAPAANLRFVFEGEEEAGSPHLARALREHAGELKADLAIVVDGPRHPSGRPTATFGARGIATAEVTVYGPAEPLHSGHYGNWAPNPAERLARLIASMQDSAGRVAIAGWYDGVRPLGAAERRALADLPSDSAEASRLLVPRPEVPESRWAAVTEPSLNVDGFRSGWTGSEARTIIPDRATADFDLRLVADIDPHDQLRRFLAHVRSQGYHVVQQEPTREERLRYPKLARVTLGTGYPAVRTAMDAPPARALLGRIRRAQGSGLVLIPTMGGSVPGYLFPRLLGASFVALPIVNHDDNQHSPDENLLLSDLFDGVVSLTAAMETTW
ncbi:MAG TPA: M20/M25/M40 family metallo-hydrolase [Gemmatimonadota bacterium]|nr:M20/M25/M40 family metallo-hydrolase [Gemmatimonadota bacterium]